MSNKEDIESRKKLTAKRQRIARFSNDGLEHMKILDSKGKRIDAEAAKADGSRDER